MPAWGGLDLGGTKIEAALFDDRLGRQAVRRVPTPRDGYDALLDALSDQIAWLGAQGAARIGAGLPGFIDAQGLARTANLPAMGRPLPADLQARTGARIVMGQDLKCFALSEANGGAGAGADRVFGLILGTGLGGALCHHGEIVPGARGILGEIGHIPLSLRMAQRHGLPLRPCGCGLLGCYEAYVAGPGLVALAQHLAGRAATPPEIAEAARSGDPDMARVLDAWLSLTAEVLQILQVSLDPEVVVLGGGLSRMPGVLPRLSEALEDAKLPGSRAPRLALAAFGDSSGTRGAALMASRA